MGLRINTRTHLLRLNLPAAAVLALLACAMLTGCSVQKRTTAPGWHVEKASKVFRQAGPSSSLTPAVRSEPLALKRMNRIPPRALHWTTSTFPADTLVVDAKARRKVKRALRREIRYREQIVMFPSAGAFSLVEPEVIADMWHDRAERISGEQGQPLSNVAPDEFARLERLRDPDLETMQDLKAKMVIKVLIGLVVGLALVPILLYALFLSL